MAEHADALICGNDEIPRHFPGRPWYRIPTCVDPAEWPVPDRATRDGPPVLGWVGTPGNARYLERIAPDLAAVCAETGARVRVVGASPPALPDVPVDFVPWSAAGEIEDLLPIDIGLAPLDDGPMERCKCGLKALQYMAAGAPVVASPVGVLPGMVRPEETGLLAGDPAEWRSALTRLVRDRDLRLRLGAAARREVETAWSFDAHQNAFEAALRGTAVPCR